MSDELLSYFLHRNRCWNLYFNADHCRIQLHALKITTLAEKIAVMQAAERGEKIEYSPRHGANLGKWFPWPDKGEGPGWNFSYYNFRVTPREMKIWVCQWKDQQDTGEVWITKNNPSDFVTSDNFRILSEQTITY